ncbi:MAG TPA: hypothetical protein VKB57_19055 [Acidimicrobiales bacterium]|nr:hypothetical protein [Acidimicrobiales bacterium]
MALFTIVATGLVGYAQGTDLIHDVESFEHFRGEQATTFSPLTAGEYTVYHEYRTGRAGDPYSNNDSPPEAFTIRVTASDGSVVAVRRRDSSAYGWGDKKSHALVSFDATAGERYDISAGGAYGQLAVGPTVPAGPLYGFGPTLLVAGTVLLACLVMSLVVRSKRRKAATTPPPSWSEASTAPPPWP